MWQGHHIYLRLIIYTVYSKFHGGGGGINSSHDNKQHQLDNCLKSDEAVELPSSA